MEKLLFSRSTWKMEQIGEEKADWRSADETDLKIENFPFIIFTQLMTN